MIGYNRQRKRVITVAGIGNEFRGDDGVAIYILKSLEKLVPTHVNIAKLTEDPSNLLEIMRHTDTLIIVDAVNSPAPPGTIFHINVSSEPFPMDFFTVSTHGIDLAQTIELARMMGLLPGFVLIYGVVGKNFSFTTSLSQQVKDSAEILKNKILSDIDKLLVIEKGEMQETRKLI